MYVLDGSTRVPRWFSTAVCLALQLPGIGYLAVGVWSANEVARLGGG